MNHFGKDLMILIYLMTINGSIKLSWEFSYWYCTMQCCISKYTRRGSMFITNFPIWHTKMMIFTIRRDLLVIPIININMCFMKVRVIPLQLQKLFARLLMSDRQSVLTTELTDSFGWINNEVCVTIWEIK